MTSYTKYESSLSCANCNDSLSRKNKTGLCRKCYGRNKKAESRALKRVASDLEESVEDASVIAHVTPPALRLKTSKTDSPVTDRRIPFDEGIMLACGTGHVCQKHQGLMKAALQSYNMEPFSIHLAGRDICAVTNAENLSFILDHPSPDVKFSSCLPLKATTTHIPVTIDDNHDARLQRALSRSPFYNKVQHIPFQEMNTELIRVLNCDWRIQPAARFATSALLAGALLMDGHQLLYINSIEPYSRLPTLDSHFERFDMMSTLPQDGSIYGDVCVIKIKNDYAEKLIISTQIATYLVVSSMRLDQNGGPELGPTTINFDPSSQTRIFCSKNAIDAANKVIERKQMQIFELGDTLSQLRQVRSKFDSISTYLPCRATSNLTNNLKCRPFTIWTIADCDDNGSRTNDVKLASQTLQAVALGVLTRDDQSLYLGDLQHLIHACHSKKSTNTLTNIQAIVAMFKNETEPLPIIHNQQLDKHLRELAIVATSSLAKANHDTKKYISNIFSS